MDKLVPRHVMDEDPRSVLSLAKTPIRGSDSRVLLRTFPWILRNFSYHNWPHSSKAKSTVSGPEKGQLTLTF